MVVFILILDRQKCFVPLKKEKSRKYPKTNSYLGLHLRKRGTRKTRMIRRSIPRKEKAEAEVGVETVHGAEAEIAEGIGIETGGQMQGMIRMLHVMEEIPEITMMERRSKEGAEL